MNSAAIGRSTGGQFWYYQHFGHFLIIITAQKNFFTENEPAYYFFINFKIIKQRSTGDLPVSLQVFSFY
jgi:hypothetical protein